MSVIGVATEQLINTVRNTEASGHLMTIMVVTKFGAIRTTNEKFMEASAAVNVALIYGNALKNRRVATELQSCGVLKNLRLFL